MENKELLKSEYNTKIYSESEKENLVREAVAQAKENFFEVLEPYVDSLITKKLLDFCNAHREVFRDLNLNSVPK